VPHIDPAFSARLNLGSGNEPLVGYVNVDRRPVPGVNVAADVTALPFRAHSVEEVVASCCSSTSRTRTAFSTTCIAYSTREGGS
jgi:hypothetical protein